MCEQHCSSARHILTQRTYISMKRGRKGLLAVQVFRRMLRYTLYIKSNLRKFAENGMLELSPSDPLSRDMEDVPCLFLKVHSHEWFCIGLSFRVLYIFLLNSDKLVYEWVISWSHQQLPDRLASYTCSVLSSIFIVVTFNRSQLCMYQELQCILLLKLLLAICTNA